MVNLKNGVIILVINGTNLKKIKCRLLVVNFQQKELKIGLNIKIQ